MQYRHLVNSFLSFQIHRKQKEHRKAQKKEWELAGTKMGNLLGIEKNNYKEDKDTEDTMDYREAREGHKFAESMKVN